MKLRTFFSRLKHRQEKRHIEMVAEENQRSRLNEKDKKKQRSKADASSSDESLGEKVI